MTKRHFEQLARIIRTAATDADGAPGRETARLIALKVADLCKGENPRFNKSRFFEACGLNNIGTGFALNAPA